MVYYYNLNPVFLNLFGLELRYYGLVYFFGFLLTYLMFLFLQKKGKLKIKNLTEKNIDVLFIYFVLGGILGGRILNFVFYYPNIFWTNPIQILKIWEGGMSFHGGLIGAITGVLIFCKKHKISFYQVSDWLVIPTSLFLVFGRIANFINGELIGKTTNINFCVKYPNVEGCRHFSQLYESAKSLIIFFVLLFLKLKKKLSEGFLFWMFILLYGGLRFFVTFFKEDPLYFGLSIGQWLSLVMFIVGIVMVFKTSKIFQHKNKRLIKDKKFSK